MHYIAPFAPTPIHLCLIACRFANTVYRTSVSGGVNNFNVVLFSISQKQPESEANEKGESPSATWVDKTELLNDRNSWRGKYHFVFGGILQSYTQNKSSAGNPLYNVKLTDPREILQNTQVLLNNYQGTTFNNKNLFNVYGFLEYDPSDQLKKEFEYRTIPRPCTTLYLDVSPCLKSQDEC